MHLMKELRTWGRVRWDKKYEPWEGRGKKGRSKKGTQGTRTKSSPLGGFSGAIHNLGAKNLSPLPPTNPLSPTRPPSSKEILCPRKGHCGQGWRISWGSVNRIRRKLNNPSEKGGKKNPGFFSDDNGKRDRRMETTPAVGWWMADRMPALWLLHKARTLTTPK